MWRATIRNLLFTIHLYRIVIAKDIRGRYYRKQVNGDMARPTIHQAQQRPNHPHTTKSKNTVTTHERPAPAAPAPSLLVSIFHMSRSKIKKALPSDFEESLSKQCNNCFAQNSGQSNCRSTWKAKEKTTDMAHTIRNFSFLFLFYGPRPNLYCIDPAGFFYLGIHFPLFQIAILGTRLSKNVPSKIFNAIQRRS